ncbi:MAG: hypothetical protein QHH75_12630 [Bacillota bacterium]|nr:hypothetical protein [Bacillota bacterium]
MVWPEKNLIFNGYFDIKSPDAEFPLGWVKVNGDDGTTLAWTGDFVDIINRRTVKVTNRKYTESFTGIVQDQQYSIEVRPGVVWELAAWMRTARAGIPLRLIAVFLNENGEYHGERHLKFTSTTKLERYSGLVVAPPGARRLKVACGVHDTPETLPSELWITWVTFRRLGDL